MEAFRQYGFSCVVVISLFAPGLSQVPLKCIPLDQCSCEVQGGFGTGSKIISLQEIDNADNPPRFRMDDASEKAFQYLYSPCTPMHNDGLTNVLMFKKMGSFIANTASAKLLDDSTDSTFSYRGISRDGTIRKTKITLMCDEKVVSPMVTKVIEYPRNTFKFSLTSKCACRGVCSYDPNYYKKTQTIRKEVLSTGSVLCIVALFFVLGYVIGGILFNTYLRKMEGWNRFPNRTFWAGFPFLVKDGFSYTYAKIKGNIKNKGQYEQIS